MHYDKNVRQNCLCHLLKAKKILLVFFAQTFLERTFVASCRQISTYRIVFVNHLKLQQLYFLYNEVRIK